MSPSQAPLKYPKHFPPTDRWKKFFIGVRWLGPDLSFFKDLKTLQASRRPEDLSVWGGGVRQELAQLIGNVLKESLGWETTIFFPDDQAEVVFHGPKFDMLDEFAFEATVKAIEHKYHIKIPKTFWAGFNNPTLGEVVDKVIATYVAGRGGEGIFQVRLSSPVAPKASDR